MKETTSNVSNSNAQAEITKSRKSRKSLPAKTEQRAGINP
jgi:hypothetical protein